MTDLPGYAAFAVRPQEGDRLTAAGHPRAIFHRAIERGNLAVADVTAREMGTLSLAEALELTALIAFKDPRRHGRAGARWMRRYLEEATDAGLDDVVFVAGCLSALGGPQHAAAAASLRAVSCSVNGTRRARDVA